MNTEEERKLRKATYIRTDDYDEVDGVEGERRLFESTKQISNNKITVQYHKTCGKDGKFKKSIIGIDLDDSNPNDPYLFITLGNKKFKINITEV